MGYRLKPGCRWSGECLVVVINRFLGVSLNTTADVSYSWIAPYITKLVECTAPSFPLKERYDYLNCTLEGLEEPRRAEEPPH